MTAGREKTFAAALLGETSGAAFSDDRVYRYRLWRKWDTTRKTLLFVMLNPSTADEVKNDPTVERCQRRAIAMKKDFGGVEVVNIFALRSTDPMALYKHKQPVGEEFVIQTSSGKSYEQANDVAIQMAVRLAGMVICGWGNHGAHLERGMRVRRMLRSECVRYGIPLMCLKMTNENQPGHPLYIGYKTTPFPLPLERT